MMKSDVRLFIYFSITFIVTEFLFHALNAFSVFEIQSLRILALSFSNASLLFLCVYLLPKGLRKPVLAILIFILAFIGFTQLSYRLYMNANYSFVLLFSMFNRITDYAGDFASYLHLKNFSIFIPLLMFILVVFKLKLSALNGKLLLVALSIAIASHFIARISLYRFNRETDVYTAAQLYANPFSADMTLNQLGLSNFIWVDTLALFRPVAEEELIIPEPIVEPVIIPEPDLARVIDDSQWIASMANETSDVMKQIDDYLLQRSVPDKHAMTGLFKDKNMILIMIEAFDWMAIDAQLTPTLSMMANQGYFFDHYYAPQYSCATGESEFIALTSLVPRSGICSVNTYLENEFPQTLFTLFNHAGYSSTSYHNYTDKFYDRVIMHETLGSSHFYNRDELDIPLLKGWPSDVNLMEEAFDVFAQSEPYFSFIITSSTHFPYDEDSTLGNRYLEEIDLVHPDYPMNIKRYISKAMELDKAMESLLKLLESKDQLEDTVLVLFGDHFPLKTERKDLLDYSNPMGDRDVGFDINRLPMIIYNSTTAGSRINKTMSSFDLLPTVANLFDLNYDPRLAFGIDIFDDKQQAVVMYPSYSWNNELGYYSSLSRRFSAYDSNQSLSEDEIKQINATVKIYAEISYQILKRDYFKQREVLR